MDQLDARLLRLLARKADATATELVPKMNLSIPAINKRILKLKQSSVIRRFTVLTDPQKVGKPVIAFVLVALDHFSHAGELHRFSEQDGDVLECYAVTGEYDFILKICAADIEKLEDKLIRLKQHCGVVKTQTLLGLREHKFDPAPLPDENESEELL